MTQLFNANFMGQIGNQAVDPTIPVRDWVDVYDRNIVSAESGDAGFNGGRMDSAVENLSLPQVTSSGESFGGLVNDFASAFDTWSVKIDILAERAKDVAFIPNAENISYSIDIAAETLTVLQNLETSLEDYQTAMWVNLLSEAAVVQDGVFSWEDGLSLSTIVAVGASGLGTVVTGAVPFAAGLAGVAALFVGANLATGIISDLTNEALASDPDKYPTNSFDIDDIQDLETFVSRLMSDSLEAIDTANYQEEFPGLDLLQYLVYVRINEETKSQYVQTAEEFGDLASVYALRTMLQGVMQGAWTFDPQLARDLGFDVSVQAKGGFSFDQITWTIDNKRNAQGEIEDLILPSSITFTEEARRITNVERSLEHFGPNRNDASSGLKDSQWYADILAKGGDLSGVLPGTSPEGTLVDPYKVKNWKMSDTEVTEKALQATGSTQFNATLGNDEVAGSADGDLVYGRSGDDTVFGGDGNDIVHGEDGKDFLVGELGDDLIYAGSGYDYVSGGLGNDTLYGQNGNDTILADAGSDTVNAGNGDDYAFGGLDSDSLLGGAGNDTLDGGAGNDTLDGGAGNDRLVGGAGIDIISTGGGHDTVYGGDGDDHVTIDGYSLSKVYGQGGNDSIMGNNGGQVLDGGAGNDTINGGYDWITADVDILFGGAGDDLLISGQTATPRDAKWQKNGDKLYGQDGHDTLQGGKSDDLLDGGAGNDTLDGGAGNDILNGGNGSDVYVFSDDFGQDLIQSFQMFGSARDVIDLSGVSTITSYTDLVGNHLSITPVFGSWWHPTTFDIEIDDGQGNSISMTGTLLPQLTQDNFIF